MNLVAEHHLGSGSYLVRKVFRVCKLWKIFIFSIGISIFLIKYLAVSFSFYINFFCVFFVSLLLLTLNDFPGFVVAMGSLM